MIRQPGTPMRPSLDQAPRATDSLTAVSVVLPCLNEAPTLAACIGKAQRALRDMEVSGEIIVADNGSTDGSQDLARSLGARVVDVEERGYGSALMGGIEAARGELIIMGDADDSYDFLEIPAIIGKLEDGFDLVMGCRLPRGGGRILPGAMPFLHRWWGNPMFSRLARWWFGAPIHDVYCGLRGFRRDFYERLSQRCTGMEFATEMVIKSSLYGARIGEVPITLHPDGRTTHAPHLRTFRDGWRTLRFFLIYTPRWLFLTPGIAAMTLGLVTGAAAWMGLHVGHARLGPHTMLFGTLAVLCGYQSIFFYLCTRVFATAEGLMPEDRRLQRFFEYATLERGLALGAAVMVGGAGLLLGAVNQWRLAGFGNLDYAQTMRWVIPGAALAALGYQTILSSFFCSILGMRRR